MSWTVLIAQNDETPIEASNSCRQGRARKSREMIIQMNCETLGLSLAFRFARQQRRRPEHVPVAHRYLKRCIHTFGEYYTTVGESLSTSLRSKIATRSARARMQSWHCCVSSGSSSREERLAWKTTSARSKARLAHMRHTIHAHNAAAQPAGKSLQRSSRSTCSTHHRQGELSRLPSHALAGSSASSSTTQRQ